MNILDDSDPFFERIYEEYSKPVMYIALGVLGNPEYAKEAFQSTFIAIANKIGKIRTLGTPEKIKSYILKTARNSAIDIYRQTQRIIKHEVPFTLENMEYTPLDRNKRGNEQLCTESFENMLFEGYDRVKLIEALGKLTKKHAIYIKEYYYDELSMRQIAQKHKISEEVAKKRVQRSLKKLRNIFFGKESE